jgi:hypothetical protein
LDQELVAQPSPQLAHHLDHADPVAVDSADHAVVQFPVAVRIAVGLVKQHVEFDSVKGGQLAAWTEPGRQILDQQIVARAALRVARTMRGVVVVPHQMIRPAPRPFGRVRRRPRLPGRKGPRLRAVAAPLDANRLGLGIDRDQLHVLAMRPIVLAVRGDAEQRQIIVGRLVAARGDSEIADVLDLDHALARLGRYIGQNAGRPAVDPMPGKVPLGLVARIASVAVEVQQDDLLRLPLFEAAEELRILRLAAQHLLVQALAHDALQTVELGLPTLVHRAAASRTAFRGTKEEHPWVFRTQDRQRPRLT